MSGILAGRVAIITGAAQGTGKGVALELGRRGATVVLADIQHELGATVQSELRAENIKAHFHHTDLSSEDSVKELVAATARLHGGVDIVASCAGIYPVQELETLTTVAWNQVFAVNLVAPFWLTRESVPYMKKAGRGRIIFTSSVTGPTVVIQGMTPYGASKAGLDGFMRGAALELAQYRITVNAVAPGAVHTPGLERACTPQEIAAIGQRIPLKRLATPADIAAAYVFLSSDEAEYYTGIVIRADGGYVLPEPVSVISSG